MTSIIVTNFIAAPLERVFDVFTDLERGAARVSNIARIEMLTTGEIKLGTRWRETRHVLGSQDSAEMEITAFERNHGYTITHQKAGVRVDAAFMFKEVIDGTLVEVEVSLARPGLPPGAVAAVQWMIAEKVRDVVADDLRHLKSFIELSAADSSRVNPPVCYADRVR